MNRAVLIILSLFILVQFIRPEYKQVKQANVINEIDAPAEVKLILKKACYDCHSNNLSLPWYSAITPISLMIANNVNDGRLALNFSNWNEYTKKEQEEKLKKMYRTVYASMPPQMYKMMHADANLSAKEIKTVREWIGFRK